MQTVRLEIIAEQVKEFNEAKEKINDKITTLETKTEKLDDPLCETLDLTKENQTRLTSIEESIMKVLELSENMLAGKEDVSQGGEDGPSKEPTKESSDKEQTKDDK